MEYKEMWIEIREHCKQSIAILSRDKELAIFMKEKDRLTAKIDGIKTVLE